MKMASAGILVKCNNKCDAGKYFLNFHEILKHVTCEYFGDIYHNKLLFKMYRYI